VPGVDAGRRRLGRVVLGRCKLITVDRVLV